MYHFRKATCIQSRTGSHQNATKEKRKPLIVTSVIKTQNQKLIINNLQFVKRSLDNSGVRETRSQRLGSTLKLT